jgi:nickel transport protein
MKIIYYLQFVILLMIFSFPFSAFGHGMDIFATVEGKIIHGKADYHDGTPVRNSDVTAFDPAGEEIGRTKTDDQGKFRLEAIYRCDYRLLVDTGDGHGGEYTISASMLPADLPTHDHSDLSHPSGAAQAGVKSQQSLLVEMHTDIDALQEQLNRYENRIRFRDILGGIGFIVGLVGAAYAYYYRGLMQKNRQAPK